MRSFVFTAVLLAAACSNSETRSEPAGQGAAVAQGAANADFQPAFAHQTRAPEMRSGVDIAAEQIARGLDEPWAIAFLPDGRALVSERPGRLRVIARDGAMSDPVSGLPAVDGRDQGGLLDVALGPSFGEDRLIYWSYTEPRGGGENATAVARGRLSEDDARVDNVEVIFRQQPAWDSTKHFGSILIFDDAGQLYVTLGERSNREARGLAQDNSTTLGKVVRINADGSVPADNPFLGDATARDEIWSTGHRNVQGAALHPETRALWTIEHGPRGGDELNIARAGRNYGWPIISYGEEYSGQPIGEGIAAREGLEQPVYYWDPVIAPGDMTFYTGDLFPWAGDLLIAGLRTEALVRLELEGERVIGEERFALGVGRIRDVAQAADGALWIITDESNGQVLRLTPDRES